VKNFLDKIILEYLTFAPPELDEAESPASKQAKAIGLDHISGGNYGPPASLKNLTPKATHKSVDGGARLVPINVKPEPSGVPPKKEKEPQQQSIGGNGSTTFAKPAPPQVRQLTPQDKEDVDWVRQEFSRLRDGMAGVNGKEVSRKFFGGLATSMKSARQGDKLALEQFLSEWGVYAEERKAGMRIYAVKNGKKLGKNRKPFGTGAVNDKLIEFFSKHGIELPSGGELTGTFSANRNLFPSQVFADVQSDAQASRTLGADGLPTSITIGDMTLNYIDPNQHKDRSETLRQLIGLYNTQMELVGKLWDDDGNFNGIIASGEEATTQVAASIMESFNKTGSPERAATLNEYVTKMSQLSGDEEQVLAEFNELHKGLLTEINQYNDPIRSSRAYIAENLTVLRETLRGSTVVVPTGTTFDVGDVISFVPKSNLPGIVNVGNVVDQVKFGAGGASAQYGKIYSSAYNSSEYGTADEVRGMLLDLSDSSKGSMYHDLFTNDNVDEVSAKVDAMYEKFGPLLLEYYGHTDLGALSESLSGGKPPKVSRKTGKVLRGRPNPVLQKGNPTGKRCAETAGAWKVYHKMGFLIDAVNNTHMYRQGYRNQSHSQEFGVSESTGGFEHNGKRSVGESRFQSNKGVDNNCRPTSAFPAHIVNTDR
jgi:hypothetical protein